jgi:hypothetical protein
MLHEHGQPAGFSTCTPLTDSRSIIIIITVHVHDSQPHSASLFSVQATTTTPQITRHLEAYLTKVIPGPNGLTLLPGSSNGATPGASSGLATPVGGAPNGVAYQSSLSQASSSHPTQIPLDQHSLSLLNSRLISVALEGSPPCSPPLGCPMHQQDSLS